ncbi:baculoviral IAP repeat-containing protein 6 (apollon) [Alternaria panax]|uniref:Baculoviral IAP repeat-containing protein 6 (Apollon) n=1 Tax=Alternaria panax TaxID=48097 RepID=A0AAD4I865_9PLEO|nr:baculoviral IAP repeat-containing protein 6 (apollon) [Alternaria panax]
MEILQESDDGPKQGQPGENSAASEPTRDSSATWANQSTWRPGKDGVRAADYQEETPTNYVTLNTFEELTAHLKATTCRICQEPFFTSELDIRRLFQDWADGAVDELSCSVRCSSCNTRSCIACQPGPFAKSSWIVSRSSKQCVSWCCVGGRLFLIWALLCGFDRHIWESRDTGKISKQPKPDPKADKPGCSENVGVCLEGVHRAPARHMPSGMGYGGYGHNVHEETDYENDTDYNQNDDDSDDLDDPEYMTSEAKGSAHALGPILNPKKAASSRPKKDNKPSKAQDAQMSEDAFGDMVLGFLTGLLPSLDRETCFDFDPPEAVLEMLRNSKILQYCAELLRNDSLVDVVQRRNLYRTLFIFLRTMGTHSETSSALFGPRFVRPEVVDLLTLSFCAAAPDLRDSVSILAQCLRNLTTQSTTILQSAKSNEEDFKSQEGQHMLWICSEITDLSQFFKENMVTETNSEKGKGAAVIPEDLAVGEVGEKLMKQTYHFYKQAKALESSRPGRFKRLVTEITTLQTGLPAGIFARYCENRPDMLKCVITGPVGTPYENGLFEFDFFCPAEYPNSPPHVNFKGTSGGRININPNLYADGKVCLSLLGTWSGEPWKAGESTLLQVLISIQAMILCEEPWYNEPGREAGYTRSPDSPSAMYNKKIREYTVRTAILDWLDKPSLLWSDVVDHHFKGQSNAILKTVEVWTKEKMSHGNQPRPEKLANMDEFHDYDQVFAAVLAPHGRAHNLEDMDAMLSKLQRALKKQYGATFQVTHVAPPPPIPPTPMAPRRTKPSWSPYKLPPFTAGPSASGASPPGLTPSALLPPSSHSLNEWGKVGDTMSVFQQQAAAAAPGRGGYMHGQGHGTFSGGDSVFGNSSYGFGGGPSMPITQGKTSTGDSSYTPRYDFRSATRARGDGFSTSSTRGGRGSSSLAPSLLPSGADVNMGRGRGDATPGRGGFGRGRGRGDGDALGGQAITLDPYPPTTPANFGRGRGVPPQGDNFTMGDTPPWTRGRGFANGRGGRGGRGRGRGGRGDGGA